MNIVFAATFDGMRTLKDKSLKIILDTQEIEADMASSLYALNGKFIKVFMTDMGITPQEIEAIENYQIEEDNGKSQSVRLRGVLFRNWQVKDEGYTVFEDYYRSKMEQLIVHFKGKLP